MGVGVEAIGAFRLSPWKHLAIPYLIPVGWLALIGIPTPVKRPPGFTLNQSVRANYANYLRFLGRWTLGVVGRVEAVAFPQRFQAGAEG